MNGTAEFLDYLKKYKGSTVPLYCDIETFTVNKESGRDKPSTYHSYTFSLAIAYFKDGIDFPHVAIFNDFIDFFEQVRQRKVRKTLKFEMIFHNGNKYDNHFMMSELATYYNIQPRNAHVSQAEAFANKGALRKSDITKEEKEGTILEKRVRSGNELELTIWLHGREIYTTDSYKKTNTSIRVIGRKLLNNGLINEQYLKTDFDYLKYDKEEDMSFDDSLRYRKVVFESLDNDQLTYIKNDVIILALCCKHYSKLFHGFDFSKKTFTQNIKEEYASADDLASFQLLKQVDSQHFAYKDFNVCGMDGFTYFRNFYKGGLNLYNDKYVGKIIKRDGFSIDLNSSYPTVMYKEKLPTWLLSGTDKPMTIVPEYNDPDRMTFFTMTIEDANEQIISKIPSEVIRKGLVKYYNSKKGLVYYNTVLLSLLHDLFGLEYDGLRIQSSTTWKCELFGARDVIARNYFIKTQGKMKNALTCTIDTMNPLDIHMTDQPKDPKYNFSDEEVAGAKVLLNGIYGVPALRVHFNLFRRNDSGIIENVKNGFTNKERNIVFSASVTAFAFRNLLTPLKYLTPEQIDEFFWYCDTDSLYMDKRALEHFPKSMFHKMNLGGWDIEHEHIKAFYPFNHKKYVLFDEQDGLVVRCGGVAKPIIDEWIEGSNGNIERFVKLYFSDGCLVDTTKSIRNEIETITIYNGHAELQTGTPYVDHYSRQNEEELEKIKELVRAELENQSDRNMIYTETPYGSIGVNDLEEETTVPALNFDNLKEEFKLIKRRIW